MGVCLCDTLLWSFSVDKMMQDGAGSQISSNMSSMKFATFSWSLGGDNPPSYLNLPFLEVNRFSAENFTMSRQLG